MKWKLILYRVEKRIFLFDPNLIFALNIIQVLHILEKPCITISDEN